MAARVSVGAGMTAGLELWRTEDGTLLLKDVSPDDRFADDVATWSAGIRAAGARAAGARAAGLRPARPKKTKSTADAGQPKQDPAPSPTPDTKPRRGRAVRR